ncbi:MAG TPA: serine/threonine-protein kinase [Ktedonobacterales bacterium]
MPQPSPQESLARGTILDGRYRIDRVIGSGGYASVYKAIDTTYNVERAIKEVTDPDKGVREQFRLEADLLINHHHPNIPRGYKVFEMNKRIYFVMDFVQGKDLEELLNESLTQQRRPLDEARVLRWAIEISGALSELHRMQTPIIHRDIKPANIKITPQDRPVLIDFGLAKLQLQSQAPIATQVAAQGVSPGFAPPEQYMARGRTDARTDIYGLGATLYACLTGRDPAEAPARLLAQTGVAHGASLDSPRVHNPRISARTEAVILKALELSPSKRQQSATEFEAELRDALNHLSGGAATGATAAMSSVAAPGRAAQGRAVSDLGSANKRAPVSPKAAQKPVVAANVQPGRQVEPQKALGKQPAASVDQRTGKQPAMVDPRAAKQPGGPFAAVASVAAFAPAAGAALNRMMSSAPAPAVVPVPSETAQHRTLAAAQQGPSRSSGKHPAVPKTAEQPAVAATSAKHPVLHMKNAVGRDATVGAVAVAAAAGGGKAFSAVATPEKEKPVKAGRMSGKQAVVAKPAPVAAAATPAAASAAAAATDPRSMISLGTIPISGFGKWTLAISAIEALWGAAALSLGILSLFTHGLTTDLLLKLGLGWLVVVAILSIYGGQALGRPIYRRGKLGGVRRMMQGTGLFLFSVLVHIVALWGATIFVAAPGNEPLAVIAYIFFGLNVLVAGGLAVFNILD